MSYQTDNQAPTVGPISVFTLIWAVLVGLSAVVFAAVVTIPFQAQLTTLLSTANPAIFGTALFIVAVAVTYVISTRVVRRSVQ